MTRLRVQARTYMGREGAANESRFVRCPTDARWVPIEACRNCASHATFVMPALGDARPQIICGRALARGPDGRDPARAGVTDAMESNVLCVNSGAPVRVVDERLAAGGHAIALILDSEGHTIGIVSRADLAKAAGAAVVRDHMTPFVISLLERASVADATELVLERGLHHVPILSEGRVLGVVSPVSALRWYVQNIRSPRRPRAPSRRKR